MDSNYSLADIKAATDGGNDFLGGSGASWLIILILFWLGFGGNGFNRGGITPSATIDQQFQTQRDVLTSSCGTQKEVLQSRYDTALGMNNMQAQMAQCCCDIKQAISTDGQATRQLITDNLINDLRSKLNDANTAIVNANQTQTILTNLGRYVPASVLTGLYGYNSYGNYSNYPYGYTNNGTVI